MSCRGQSATLRRHNGGATVQNHHSKNGSGGKLTGMAKFDRTLHQCIPQRNTNHEPRPFKRSPPILYDLFKLRSFLKPL
jgi:hypothetical protein